MIRIKNTFRFTDRSSEAFKNILRVASKYPRLSNEEQVRLVAIYQANPNAIEGLEARDQLVESNLFFVVRIAKQFVYRTDFPIGDLFQEGCKGLLTAIDCYRQQQGATFLNYAVNWIYQSIQQFVDKYGRIVRLPQNQLTLNKRIEKVSCKLYQLNERKPTLTELADDLGESIENIRYAMMASGNVISLDMPINDDDDKSGNIVDLFQSDYYYNDADMYNESRTIEFRDTLNEKLSPREKEIIMYAFGLCGREAMSNAQIAKLFGITAERVRQIIEACIRKLSKSENLLAYCA